VVENTTIDLLFGVWIEIDKECGPPVLSCVMRWGQFIYCLKQWIGGLFASGSYIVAMVKTHGCRHSPPDASGERSWQPLAAITTYVARMISIPPSYAQYTSLYALLAGTMPDIYFSATSRDPTKISGTFNHGHWLMTAALPRVLCISTFGTLSQFLACRQVWVRMEGKAAVIGAAANVPDS
jgi:hypothetical protein